MQNPKSIIEEKLNYKLPDNIGFEVHGDTPINSILFCPEELAELELLAVSGGSGCRFVSYPDPDCSYNLS